MIYDSKLILFDSIAFCDQPDMMSYCLFFSIVLQHPVPVSALISGMLTDASQIEIACLSRRGLSLSWCESIHR